MLLLSPARPPCCRWDPYRLPLPVLGAAPSPPHSFLLTLLLPTPRPAARAGAALPTTTRAARSPFPSVRHSSEAPFLPSPAPLLPGPLRAPLHGGPALYRAVPEAHQLGGAAAAGGALLLHYLVLFDHICMMCNMYCIVQCLRPISSAGQPLQVGLLVALGGGTDKRRCWPLYYCCSKSWPYTFSPMLSAGRHAAFPSRHRWPAYSCRLYSL